MIFVQHQMIMGSVFAVYNFIIVISQQIKKGSMCVVYDISTRIKKIILFPLSSKRFWFHNETHFSHFFPSDFYVEQQIIKDTLHAVYFLTTFVAHQMIIGSMFAVCNCIVFLAQEIKKSSMLVVYDISTRIKKIIMFSLSSTRFWLHNKTHFCPIFRLDFFTEQQIVKDPWHVVYFVMTFNAH